MDMKLFKAMRYATIMIGDESSLMVHVDDYYVDAPSNKINYDEDGNGISVNTDVSVGYPLDKENVSLMLSLEGLDKNGAIKFLTQLLDRLQDEEA